MEYVIEEYEQALDSWLGLYNKILSILEYRFAFVKELPEAKCPRCDALETFECSPDDPINDLFRCRKCNELVHISSIILVDPSDTDVRPLTEEDTLEDEIPF